MEIKPKYNIGQIMHYMSGSDMCKGSIESIQIKISRSWRPIGGYAEPFIVYQYCFYSELRNNLYYANEIFETQQDLINGLIKDHNNRADKR